MKGHKIQVLLAIIALVVAIGVGYWLRQPPFGGSISVVAPEFPNGEIIGGVNVNWAKGSIPVGTTTNSWRNNTGNTVFVDYVSLWPSVVGSSTMHYFVGTSTAAGTLVVPYTDYQSPNPTQALLIYNGIIGTSTQKLLTNFNGAPVSVAGNVATTTTAVANGQYITFFVKSDSAACSGSGRGGSAYNTNTANCDQATSTTRAPTTWYIRYHY